MIWSSPRWLLLHASKPAGVAGHLMLHARRHVVGPIEFNTGQVAAEFGPCYAASPTRSRRRRRPSWIYTRFMSESSPHLHVHLVPRLHDADVTGFDLFQLQARAKSGAVAAAADARVAPSRTRSARTAARPPSCGGGGVCR